MSAMQPRTARPKQPTPLADVRGASRVVIDLTPDVVPDRGHQLPLVDEARAVTREQHGRSHEAGGASLVVDIEPHFAPCDVPCGLGLPTSAGALDEDRARRSEASGELRVNDPRSIGYGSLAIPARLGGTHLQQY